MISVKEFRTTLKLDSMTECFQDRRMQQFGHLQQFDHKECKRVVGLVNVEPSGLVSPEDDLEKDEME